MNAFLPDQTRISQVHLRTAKLGLALAFYSEVLGLKALRTSSAQASLSVGDEAPPLIVLSEDVTAAPRAPRSIGLYHFALRYPQRQGLARAYRRLLEKGYSVAGASDHGVSEAIYLNDADGNGVELYADRPQSQWSWRNGEVAMFTSALDLDNLLAIVEQQPAAADPTELEIGHIHLHVADLAVAERFYREFLGLAVTQRSCPGALFLAAGNYHHHIAINNWAGKTPSPKNGVGLISYRLEVFCREILYCLCHRAPLLGYEIRSEEKNPLLIQIRDPNGNWLEVQARPGSAEASQLSSCTLGAGMTGGGYSLKRQRVAS